MEINVHKFQEAVLAGTFEHTEVHLTAAAFKKDGVDTAMAKVFADVRSAIEKNQLIQADLVIDFPEPTTITVETGVINLPFANVNKITNFLEPDEIVPVRVYLIVTSPFVNVSGLRIDETATAADYLQDFATINDQMIASVQEKLDHIQTEMAKPKEIAKEVPANKQKPAAKKTTRRTATKKRTTTRKTTKKTATASKAAAKTTTAKKTTTRKTAKK
ncbi:hypothetical protein FEZ34_04400 [Lacticaseibacillus casei]|uniref:hypothetical protein n=1 Tax=Lacticaseibacillus casei TaxID=1582 RepID=UPI00110899D4|nr:hypothetical protein [Lacticaseibacillus casei]TLQ51429.1 hypothetical protein FEZ34_04400 [Lacticaseibacillus casei]